MATVTIPNLKIHLTLEQLIAASRQLTNLERATLAKTLIDTELDEDLTQLISDLYTIQPSDDISDADIMAEVNAVRRQSI